MNVVQLQTRTPPNCHREKCGKSGILYMEYMPDRPEDLRWHWILRVTKTYEFISDAASVDDCRTQARRYAEQLDR